MAAITSSSQRNAVTHPGRVRHERAAQTAHPTQVLSSCVTNGGGHDAHATPSSVARVFSKRGFHGQERAVINVMAQLQRSPTPPSVPASRSSRKFVQPPQDDVEANCWRCCRPQRFRGDEVGYSARKSLTRWGCSLRFVSRKNAPEATNPLIRDAGDDRDVCPYVHSGSFHFRHRHAPC